MHRIPRQLSLLALGASLSCATRARAPAEGPGSADARRVSAVKDSGTARAPGDATTDPKILVRDERYDWRGLAIAIDGHVVCPKRQGADTTFWADLDSARAVPPNSLRSIEVLKGAHIPDSSQRVCPSRLRGIIYLRTRP